MRASEDDAIRGGALSDRSGRIVAAHKLLRRARRYEVGEFLADGAQAVREAVAAEREQPGTVREIYVTATGSARNTQIVRAAFDVGITVTEITDRAAAHISDAVTPQGLTARCTLPTGALRAAGDGPLTAVLAAAPRLVAVLVQTSDPGNTGTVIRLADAAGADAVIVAGDAVDPWGPKAVRASAGSIFHLPVLRAADPAELVVALSGAGLAVLATSGAGQVDLDDASAGGLLDLPTAWLFGSEAHGLANSVIDAADAAIRVPIHGRAESLNLATAAAICLYASATAQRRG
ncbi:MAG: RNA methyltransferase [Actinobacteria bacterium 69-20]|nr:RNA methyltransferase [Actinomycetota bacterium]OJV25890.1 MAG: RNA methyltransferase [Actinobacteria bacterium 69-20]